MRIQYALVRVTQEIHYYPGDSYSDNSFQYVTEQGFLSKDTEREIEEWLEGAFVAAAKYRELNRIYYRAAEALARATRNPRLTVTVTFEEAEEKRKAADVALAEYQSMFGYYVVSDDEEYRIVKIYSA